MEFPEDLLGPAHLKVYDGAEREGHIGNVGKVGEVVVELLCCFVAERVGAGSGWARGSCKMEDLGQRVLAGERGGGDGGRGRNDEGSLVISGVQVVAELRARLKMALPSC